MDKKPVQMLIAAAAVILVIEVVNFILKKIRTGNRRTDTVLALVRSLLRYAAAIVILCVCLNILGFDPKSIAASIGILTLIIGFSAESLIADLVTGVFMIFENQYNVGDILEVQDFRGTVVDMGIRTTSLMDTGGNIKIINNSEMQNILNRSDKLSVAVVDIAVTILPEFPVFESKIPAMLSQINELHPDQFPKGVRYLGVEDIEGDTALLRFAADVPEPDIYAAQRMMNRELMVRFTDAGVQWPAAE